MPCFPSSPLEPVRQSLTVGANEVCSILTHSARWVWAISLHRSARTYTMSLNSVIFKIDFSLSEGFKIVFIQAFQKEWARMKTSYGQKPCYSVRDESDDRVFQKVYCLLKWAESLDFQCFARCVTKKMRYVFLFFSCHWLYRNIVMLTAV